MRPEDFLVDYSPNSPAVLETYIVDESRVKGVVANARSMARRILNRMGVDPIAAEVARAWERIGQPVSLEKVCHFLEQKFSTDHMRRFEYPFQAMALCRPDVRTRIIVDVGGGNCYSTIVPILLQLRQSEVICVDVVERRSRSKFGVSYVRGDCARTGLADEQADVVTMISTIEHVGLGRWGDPLDTQGDLRAVQEARRILKTGGHLVLTTPYGYPTVVYNMHRIYDRGRLERLIDGFEVVDEKYSVLGAACERDAIEGRRTVREIPGFYQGTPVESRFPNPAGGVMLVLKKMKPFV
jgi:SAM-dependent methyltransferase